MKIVSLISAKGGVSKTTTAYQWAHLLSGRKERVLAVDLDSQSSLTSLYMAGQPVSSIADVLANSLPLEAVIQALGMYLSLAPSSIELAGVELQLVNRPARETVLRRALATVADTYDVAIVDCPPALGLLTANALTASDVAVILTQPEAMSLHSLQHAIDAIEFIKSQANPRLELAGILVTQYAGYLNHHSEALAAMKAAKLPMFKTPIPRAIRAADIAVSRQPITGPTAEAYEEALKELNKWLRK